MKQQVQVLPVLPTWFYQNYRIFVPWTREWKSMAVQHAKCRNREQLYSQWMRKCLVWLQYHEWKDHVTIRKNPKFEKNPFKIKGVMNF
jgi:hypothetical protein